MRIAPAPPEEIPAPPEERAPSAPRVGPPVPGPVAIALAVIMVASVVIAFLGAFAFGIGGLQEQRSQHQLYAMFRGLLDPSSTIAPKIGGAIPAGWPVALINAPDAGLHNVVVVEGSSSGDLLDGPGHLPDTPLPGQVGQSLLLGRSVTAGAPFGGITRLRRGDVVTVTTGQGTFRFIVKDQRIAGDRKPAIPRDGSLLTLVTSAGSGWLGHISPDRVVYVDATLHGKPVTAPPGRPRNVPAVEMPGHNDPAAWPWVLSWLVALCAGSAACWWMWARWGIVQTWLVGAPVLLGILWALSTEAMRLFPNIS
jgi:sortase A